MIKQPIDMKTAQKVAVEAGKELSVGSSSPMEAITKDEKLVAYIRSLGLTRKQVADSIPALLEYQADQAVCEHCPGKDKCPKDNKWNEISLALENGRLVRTNGPCRLERKDIEISARFFIVSCPLDWLSKRLSTKEAGRAVRRELTKRLAKVKAGTVDCWVYAYGDSGSGKSYVLASSAGSYAKKNPGCAFVSTPDIVEELKEMSINDKKEFEKMLNRLSTCPLVVFDDFGNEFKSEYTFSSILFPILQSRAKNKLLTYFASDFPIKDIQTMYSSKIGEVRSRQLYRMLKSLSGTDYDISGLPVD